MCCLCLLSFFLFEMVVIVGDEFCNECWGAPFFCAKVGREARMCREFCAFVETFAKGGVAKVFGYAIGDCARRLANYQ